MARSRNRTPPCRCVVGFGGTVLLLLIVSRPVCLGQDTTATPAPEQDEDTAQQPRLVWTELRIVDRRARIQSLPADPDEYISSTGISSKYYYELTPAHWIAIAGDYDDGVAFWSDANHKRIMRGGLREGATATGIFDGTSSTVDGIAVDWLANNVYWTDAAYNWIIVVDYNVTYFKIIIDDGLDKPRGVAVYPQLGYLFWTDWGSSQTIERSSLAGEGRQVLVDTGLYFPNGLTVDYGANKLYWTDADPSGSRLEFSNLDGTNRSTLYSHPADQGHFFDVAIFQNYIFISDWYNGIRCVRKNTGEHYFALRIGGRPFGLTTYGPGLLPGNSSPCDAKPCSQLCVSDRAGFKCLCMDGYNLLEDGRQCHRRETTLAKPQILLVAQTSICYFPSNFPDLTLPQNYQRNCILSNRTHLVALDVDVRSRTMFFSDFVHKTIQSVRLADGAGVELVVGGVGSAEGIAVDWLAQNLYWTDFQLDHIAVARYDGSNRRILLKEDILDPRSIVIHAGRRLMFWTEFGPPTQIERASLDGSDRRVILNNVEGPNGLAIDFENDRLYYAERGTGAIQHMDFDGNGKTRVYSRTGAQYFDIDLHKDYLLWTEWNTFNGLHAINRENRRVVQSHGINNETTYGVRIYSDERQPDYDNVCEDNGACQHLCLPISSGGRRCECSIGYHLHTDGRSCVAGLDILYDDFLLASDAYLHSIFQINVSDPDLRYSALQLDSQTIENPVGLAYDPIEAQVYWSDVTQNTVRRAYIFNGTQEILFTHEHVEIPDDLTIDPTSHLLFWTDMGLPSIQVSHLDGSNRKSLILTDIEKPRAILADPGNGLLYWSDWGTVARIEKAFMDGTNREVLVNTSLVWPNGLALDFSANKLYWCDANTDVIEVLNLDTMVRAVLIDLGPETHPFSIALHGPHIYWSDWSKKTLMRADKDTGANNGTVGPADFSRLNGLHSYSTRDHAPFSNACVSGLANGGCSVLCLPTPSGRVCACPDGSTLQRDGISCSGAIRCPATFYHGHVQADCSRVPGSTCNVECDAGYRPSDDRIGCSPDGFWDAATDSICEQVRCPSPSVPQHSIIVNCLTPHVHGNQCIFRCQVGYFRASGDEELMCTVDGQWSGTPLSCQAVTCAALPALSSGVYAPNECSTAPSPYNTTCRVLCPRGYQLIGVTSHMCQANGEWTDVNRNSSCIDVMPPDFGNSCPNDTSVTADYGQVTVSFTWTEPRAVDNSGEEPSISSNVVQPLQLGEGRHTVTYYASDSSGGTSVCSFVVEVEVLSCSMLGYPINGYFEHCTHHYGSVCAIRCNEGYAVHGSAQRSCNQTDGQTFWTGAPGSCRLIECDEPPTYQNVFKADCSAPYYFRAECSYTCAPGYERSSGSEYRICQKNSLWSGSPLECRRRTCPPYVPGEHATVDPVNCHTMQNFFGDSCTLSCEEGYQLVGVASHTCQANGEWSDADDGHFCQDIAAPHFNGTCPSNFALIAPRGQTEAVVTWTQPVVMDNEGNELNVTSSRQPGVSLPGGLHAILIRATDQAGNQGTCRFVVNITVVRCPLHRFPHFGDFRGERCDNYFGSQCNFSCMEGYRLSGSGTRTCEWSGLSGDLAAWTGERPECEPVMCPIFEFPVDTIDVRGCDPKAPSLPFNSRCMTVCVEGKRPVAGSGNGQRRCTEDGTWNGENIQCEDVHCPPLRPLISGSIAPADCTSQPSDFGTSCSYSCGRGFVLTGVLTVLCLASGNWSVLEEHTCRDTMAPEFADPCPHIVMTLIPDACTNGYNVTYTRPTAEDNSGSVVVTGGEDDVMGTLWGFGVYERSFTARDPSGNTAACRLTINVQRVECPALSSPPHGSIVAQTCGHQSGSRADFVCDDGYLLIGSSRLVCEQDGQWNATIPTCSAVFCSPLVPPDFSVIQPAQCLGDAVYYGTACTITCNAGYGLLFGGSTSATCLRNGQWSSDISNTSICVDITPPEFSECPAAQSYTLPLGEATVEVTLATPTATDNSGVAPTVRTESSGSMQLGPGTHFFNFIARDQEGNTANCLTEITVTDAEPPTVVSCPNGTVVEQSSLPVTLRWEEPVFDDNVGITSVDSDCPNGKRVYEWGLFVVTYTARDEASNTNTCKISFDIVDNTTCPTLQPPPNGALACESNNYCTVHCNDGYVFLDGNRPRDTYVCLGSGRWSHELTAQSSMPYLPACTRRGSGTRVRWERRDMYAFSLHHLQGSCEDSTKEIQDKFVSLFMTSAFMYCQQDPANNCKMENIVVNCGEITDGRRRRRQAESDANADISTTLVIERNDSTDIDTALAALNASASDMWGPQNVTFDLTDGGTAFLDKSRTVTGTVNVMCEVGTVASGMLCVNCPKGTRYKLSIGDCVPCGRGTYQDTEGVLTCKLCPAGTMTIGEGAFELAQCQDMCPAGQISFWGVTPCQPCPIGSYQPQVGQHGCEPCPLGMTTRVTGATTFSQCTATSVRPTARPPVTEHRVTSTTTAPRSPASASTGPNPTGTLVISPTTLPSKPDLPATTGKVDVGIITKKPGTGGGDDNNTDRQTLPFNWVVVVVPAVCVLIALVVITAAVCFVVRRRRSGQGSKPLGRPRPISWSGSTRAMLPGDDEMMDEVDLVAIHNPVFGMTDNEPCTSPLSTSNFSTFLDPVQPLLAEDTADIPKLDPPPKRVK